MDTKRDKSGQGQHCYSHRTTCINYHAVYQEHQKPHTFVYPHHQNKKLELKSSHIKTSDKLHEILFKQRLQFVLMEVKNAYARQKAAPRYKKF